jgi:hypothetical protein
MKSWQFSVERSYSRAWEYSGAHEHFSHPGRLATKKKAARENKADIANELTAIDRLEDMFDDAPS